MGNHCPSTKGRDSQARGKRELVALLGRKVFFFPFPLFFLRSGGGREGRDKDHADDGRIEDGKKVKDNIARIDRAIDREIDGQQIEGLDECRELDSREKSKTPQGAKVTWTWAVDIVGECHGCEGMEWIIFGECLN